MRSLVRPVLWLLLASTSPAVVPGQGKSKDVRSSGLGRIAKPSRNVAVEAASAVLKHASELLSLHTPRNCYNS